jgi:hypothetical protein
MTPLDDTSGNRQQDPSRAMEAADDKAIPTPPVLSVADNYPPRLLPPQAPPVLADPPGTPPPLPDGSLPQGFAARKKPTANQAPWVVVAMIGLLGAGVLGCFVDGEFGHLLRGSWSSCLFTLMAVLAYVGRDQPWARWASWLLLAGMVALTAIFNVAITSLALTHEDRGYTVVPAGVFLRGQTIVTIHEHLGHQKLVGLIVLLLSWACLVPALLPALRRSPLGITRLDEGSGWNELRRLALGTTIALTLSCIIPLLMLGEPPVLAAMRASERFAAEITGNRGPAGWLRDHLYSLVWILSGSALTVGWGIARDTGHTLRRLGLEGLSLRHLGIAGASTALLVGLGHGLDLIVSRVWGALGWRTTDTTAVEALFAGANSPLGALVVGITAGVGEEVAVRGILQPRLGILISNAFFTAMHAYQYHWDALCSVFLVGLALGWIRRKTSTTVAALVHGGYDFVIILMGYFESR